MKHLYTNAEMLTSEQLEAAVAHLDCTRMHVFEYLMYAGFHRNLNVSLEAVTYQLVSPVEPGKPGLLRVCDRCGCWTATNTCDVCVKEASRGR